MKIFIIVPLDFKFSTLSTVGQAVTACGAGRAQAPASKQEPACGAAR